MDDVGVERLQYELERPARAFAPARRRDVEDRDRLPVEAGTADRPVEGVLERPWNPEGVLGHGEQDARRSLARRPEAEHGFGRRTFEIRIEVRQLAHRVADREHDPLACRRRCGGTEGGAVHGGAPQASGNRKDHAAG